jgi:hypothetical protein
VHDTDFFFPTTSVMTIGGVLTYHLNAVA